jgi:class 3 adenylate cyclase
VTRELDRRELELLNQITRIASYDLQLRPMLQRVTDALAAAFGWEFIACMTIDLERRRFVCQAMASRVPTEVTVGYGRALGSGVVGEVALTGNPILLDDTSVHANYIETLPGARSELCVPVKTGGRVLAIINLESPREAAFHDQLPLLEAVAQQLKGPIYNAYLLDEMQRRADALQMMSDLTRTAMEAGGLQPLLQRVVEYVHHRMEMPLVAILLVDERGRELELAAHAGAVPVSVSEGARWPVGEGVVGRAVRLGRAQLVADVRADPNYVPIAPGVVSELAIPIKFQERVLGVMNIEVTSPDAFSGDTVLVLHAFVDQVAGAIHMATVNRRLAEANRTLTDLFARYVAPDLAEQLIADPERFHNRGERREAAVLFADIRGFTRLCQRLESDRLLALLNDLIPTMADAVFAQRGSINRFLGDGFMALFGVPEKLADPAGAAVRAALEMQRRVEALSARWQAVTGEPLRMVFVANAGEVVAGSIGDPRHREFTVLGDVVNVASRLEAEAKARNARIVVTGMLHEKLGGRHPSKDLGDVELRGRDGAVRLWEIT